MNNLRIFYVDTETTGLSEFKNDIIQIAGAFVENDVLLDTFNFRCQPINWDDISEFALSINHNTIEKLKTYEMPNLTFQRLYDIMCMNSNGGKWRMGGMNANKFDYKFIRAWWNKHKQPSDLPFEHFVDIPGAVDLMEMTKPMKANGTLLTENVKLGTIADHFKVIPKGELHDALTDILVTIECVEHVSKSLIESIADNRNQLHRFPIGIQEFIKFKTK